MREAVLLLIGFLIGLLISTSASAYFTGWPNGTTPVNVNSGVVANTEVVLTIPATPNMRNYLVGLGCSSNGAAAGAWLTATLEGLIGGTRYIVFRVNETAPVGQNPASATAGVSASVYPEPAAEDNMAIVFTLPALGAGNTMTSCSMTGFTAGSPEGG